MEKRIVDIQRVSIAVEGAFKTIIFSAHPCGDVHIGGQFEVLAGVVGAVLLDSMQG